MTHESLVQMEQRLQSQFPEKRVLLADGSELAWREAGTMGSEFAVVLLHGISSGAASWLDVASTLSTRVRVLAWDAPGYGASTAIPTASPRDFDYAQALRHSLQALGVHRCVLVGHSLGALMAARLAVESGVDLVQQLVLISPAGGYGNPAKVEQRQTVRSGRLSSLAEKGVAGLSAVIDQRLVSASGSDAARAWVRWNTARMHASGYAQAVELLCESDLGLAAGKLSMSVQVWVGAQDAVTTPANCQGWAQMLGASFATLEGAGHASPIEIPQVIAERLLNMLP